MVKEFTVTKIEKAGKAGYGVSHVVYEGNATEYTFVRKVYSKDGHKATMIDGCEVEFKTNPFEVLDITRKYETKGKKRLDTSSIGGKKKVSEVSQKQEDEEQQWEEIEREEKEVVEEKEEAEETTKYVEYEEDAKHEEYETIKTCVQNFLPIYLVGPAGSGKNFTLEQIAKELDIVFYFTNSVQQEYQLTGFVDAGGNYHDTQFYRACKQASEGVETMFFLDEMDASIPEVLVKLNMAIAQGYFEFPNGEVLDFGECIHWVAAGNTVGSGADENYTGRMVLDQASLDRFVIIEFGYSENIEKKITKGNVDLISFIHELRKFAEDNGIRATFSYRCMTMVTKLESSGMKLDKILKISVFKGLDNDTIKTFNTYGISKYDNALRDLKIA